jgi:hypothetical protein
VAVRVSTEIGEEKGPDSILLLNSQGKVIKEIVEDN